MGAAMPVFLRAKATAIAKRSCCWNQRRRRIRMHLPCSDVSSMVTMVDVDQMMM